MILQFVKSTCACSLLAGALALATSARADTKVYPTDLTNIAAASNGGHIVNSTSMFEDSAQWSADNLIDGRVYDAKTGGGSMGWSSNKFDPINMDSVTLAFAKDATKRIGKIVLNPTASVPPERWAKDIEVQVSRETAEGPYHTAGLLTLRREAKPQEFLILPTEAKFVRLLFRSNQGSDRAVALGEVEIYEAIPQTDSLGQLIGSMEQAITELKQYRRMQVERGNDSTLAAADGNVGPIFNGSNAPSAATIQLVQMAIRDDAPLFPVSSLNIAAAKNGGKIINYSSLFSNDQSYAAKNLIDGQVYDPKDPKSSSGWSSEGFAPGREYVTLGFGDDKLHLIGKIVLNPSSNQAILRWARRIEVQASSGSGKDGPWRTVTTLTLRPQPLNQPFIVRPFEAKFLRFVFLSNGPSEMNLPGLTPGVNSDRAVSLGEIEVYEASSTSNVLDAVIGRFESILVSLKSLRKEGTTKAEAPAKNEALHQVG